MTGDPGPEKQPEALTPDDPNATKAAPSDDGGRSLLARIPGGRTLLTVLAAIIAVSAIAATTYALARNGGDETATPNEEDSGAVTFGPNEPDSSATTSLPTFPTSLPTDAFTFPSASLPTTSFTTPTFTGIPTSTYSYSPPAYTPPTFNYTPPTFPTATLPTTPTTTTTGPTKTTVYPVAPQATPITRCGTYGELRIDKTTGVKYSLVVGDGRKGRWVVSAAARKGYVIADGATKRWSGNLGRYKECPLGFRKVAASEADGAWNVKVRLWVPEKEDRALGVAYSFLTDVTVESITGEGWTCGELTEGSLSCSYDGEGTPPTLKVRVQAGKDGPTGSVGLFADGEQVDVGAFDGSGD